MAVQAPALPYHNGASIASDNALPETPYGNAAPTGTVPAGYSTGPHPVSSGTILSNGHTGWRCIVSCSWPRPSKLGGYYCICRSATRAFDRNSVRGVCRSTSRDLHPALTYLASLTAVAMFSGMMSSCRHSRQKPCSSRWYTAIVNVSCDLRCYPSLAVTFQPQAALAERSFT